MNERIKELERQATSYMPGRPPYDGLTFDMFDKEKFAELIVRECMDVVAKKCASPTAYNALVEHFGVEE